MIEAMADDWTPIRELASSTGLDRCSLESPPSVELVWEFLTLYDKLVTDREIALRQSRDELQSQLSGSISFSADMVNIAQQICWYYDTLLVVDPLRGGPGADIDSLGRDDCVRLVQNYGALAALAPAMKCGIVRLQDRLPRSEPTEGDLQACGTLVAHENIREAAYSSAQLGLGPTQDKDGVLWQEFRVGLNKCWVGGWKGVAIPPGQHYSPSMDLFTELPHCTAGELDKEEIEWRGALDPLLPRAAWDTLYRARFAAEYGSRPVLTQQFDASVLMAANSDVPMHQGKRVALPLRVLQPYLRGVSLERLIDARMEAPESFAIMRAELSRMTSSALAGSDEDVQEIIEKIRESSVLPELAQLQSDLLVAAKRAKISVEENAVIAVGSLVAGIASASVFGIMAAIPVAVGGLAMAAGRVVRARGQRGIDVESKRTNPWYFVWSATQD